MLNFIYSFFCSIFITQFVINFIPDIIFQHIIVYSLEIFSRIFCYNKRHKTASREKYSAKLHDWNSIFDEFIFIVMSINLCIIYHLVVIKNFVNNILYFVGNLHFYVLKIMQTSVSYFRHHCIEETSIV